MLNHIRSWLYVDHLSRPIVVLNGLSGLYGLNYYSATACGLPLYLCSYKLVGSATPHVLVPHLRYLCFKDAWWDGRSSISAHLLIQTTNKYMCVIVIMVFVGSFFLPYCWSLWLWLVWVKLVLWIVKSLFIVNLYDRWCFRFFFDDVF